MQIASYTCHLLAYPSKGKGGRRRRLPLSSILASSSRKLRSNYILETSSNVDMTASERARNEGFHRNEADEEIENENVMLEQESRDRITPPQEQPEQVERDTVLSNDEDSREIKCSVSKYGGFMFRISSLPSNPSCVLSNGGSSMRSCADSFTSNIDCLEESVDTLTSQSTTMSPQSDSSSTSSICSLNDFSLHDSTFDAPIFTDNTFTIPQDNPEKYWRSTTTDNYYYQSSSLDSRKFSLVTEEFEL